MRRKIAIIGAGISGLVIANELNKHSDVLIFEKARGVGGRMSTRFSDPFYFDHGAQCFTARTKEFNDFLYPLIKQDIIGEWKGKIVNLEIGKETSNRLWNEPHLVAIPNMNSLCKFMSKDISIKLNTEIIPLSSKYESGWKLFSKEQEDLGTYDWVISTLPAPQASILFATNLKEDSLIRSITMNSCYSTMIGFKKPFDHSWIAAKVRNNPIKWISINSTKPGRNNKITSIVIQSTSKWANNHLNCDIKHVEELLTTQFKHFIDIDCKKADYLSTHRWKYAIVQKTEKSGPYIDEEKCLASTSDWCETSRIEEVYLNAVALAKKIKLLM